MSEVLERLRSVTAHAQEHPRATNKELCLPNVFKVLMPLASNWQNVGVFLRLSSGQLSTIEADNDKSADRLREMLKGWLKLVNPPPSWEELVEAVEVIDASKAKEICDKYCIIMSL